jgi:1-acyl-sn-glycerol-3-phosphate acyltransferase
MQDREPIIHYPRRTLQRTTLRVVGRALLPLLTRTQLTGFERFPKSGPLLVVGNHIAAMEAVLMVLYSPWQIELLGAGDIRPPPAMDAIARFYGYTPINRGNVDRAPLIKILDLLERGGIVGVFPEGGIWDTGDKPAKRGVTWLSHRANVPILPIGFGGVEGALNKLFRLQRPKLWMNVGTLMPPVALAPGKPRKACLQQAAAQVMQAANDLIPEEGRVPHPQMRDERFELCIRMQDTDGTLMTYPPDLEIAHADALVKMFYRPAILRIFKKDLRLPVEALQQLDTEHDPAKIACAIRLMLDYVEQQNPGFFPYRFGHAEGMAMEAGLRELHAVATHAAKSGYLLSITPIRHYYSPDQGKQVTESDPGQSHLW